LEKNRRCWSWLEMIEKLLNPYELKARVAPALIVLFPLFVAAIYAAPSLSGWSIFAAGSLSSIALLYGATYLVRARGNVVEEQLWNNWGGPPSTRFIRYSDQTFAGDLKSRIRATLIERFHLYLPSIQDEALDSRHADRLIFDGFRQVRQYLRKHDPNGLWLNHLTEYGFCRNLLACRSLWIFLAAAGTVFSSAYGAASGRGAFNPASVVDGSVLACALYASYLVLPNSVKRIAELYAESAWMSFLYTCEEEHPSVRLLVGLPQQ
jgi:hypothetical protein